ncbi:MAG: LPP20 family lipoprotein [Rikenellaceae bacterium]
MIRRGNLILLALIYCLSLNAQSVKEIKSDRATYIYGEGKSTTLDKADQAALSAIISQISVSVKSGISSSETEKTKGKNSELSSTFESVINTYSSATLSSTERVIIENEPDAHVFRYIKRTDIERIFEARKLRILNMIEDAQEALDNRQINDALRYYYWAHALVKSLRYPNELEFYDNNGAKQLVNTWLPVRINEILSALNINVLKVDEDNTVTLGINYKGDRVSSVDYTYFDGSNWSNLYTAREGRGVLELRKSVEINKIQVKVECQFLEEAIVDDEIKTVLDAVESPVYKKAYFNVFLDEIKSEDSAPTIAKEEQKKKTNSLKAKADKVTKTNNQAVHTYPTLSQLEDITPFKTVVDEVVTAINSKNSLDVESHFTEEGFKAYKELIGYGQAKILDAAQPKFYSLGENTYCRNILMNFSFKTNKRVFAESVVFEFDNTNKISNVTFGLSRVSTDDILGKSMWPEQARLILIHFLEGYKSAYAFKQIDYIESVFAEDALIITGAKVRNATQAELQDINTEYVRYTQQSKSQYVYNLKKVFARNEYINIKFADSDLMRAGKGGEIYGIQIKQEYMSTYYGDSGYLFLMVDLNNIKKPIIHVRTWQEDKDPNFGVYGLEHF